MHVYANNMRLDLTGEIKIMLNILTTILIIIVGIFFILGVLAARGTVYIWLLFCSICTIVLQLTEQISIPTSVILWLIIFLCLFLCHKNIRQRLFSYNILQYLKNKLPNVNDIENLTIAAVNPWFESDILNGHLNWSTLLQGDNLELSAREHMFLNNQVDTLCNMLNDCDVIKNKLYFSPQILEYLKQHRFLSMVIPVEYGGLGFSAFAISEIIQKIATKSVGAAINIAVPNALGPQELLLKYGTKLQKDEYLPQLASGYHIPACAATSHAIDKDVNLMSDNGVICRGKYQDQEILGVMLNWDKCYVTLGPIATLISVIVRLYDPHNLLNGIKKDLGLTVFLIPANFIGITNKTKYLSLNPTLIMGPVTGKDVFVPLEFIIGGKDMIGLGDQMLSYCLAVSRGISLTSIGAAISKLIFKNISAYSVISKKFGLPIIDFNGTDSGIAKIFGYSYMIESMRLLTLTAFEKGYNSGVLNAISKCCITDLGREMINIVMDINGGKASVLASDNYLSEIYQNIPMTIIMDGSNNLLKNKMIFQSAIIKCHPFLGPTIEALQSFDVKLFDQHFFNYISYVLSNFAKMILHACSNKIFCVFGKHSGISKDFISSVKELNFFSMVLSCLVEISFLQYGLLPTENARVWARLTNILSYISMGCAVIKYHSKNINDPDENIIVEWCIKKCFHEIQHGIFKLLQNFSNQFLAKILGMIIFPFGKKYTSPDDALEYQISNIMLKNTELRSKLINKCYISSDDNLEVAFKKILNTAPLYKKIDLAEKTGIISKNSDLNITLNLAMKEKILTELEVNLIQEAEVAANVAFNAALHVDECSINSL